MAGPSIGIITPPEDIKNIVLKTAQFVAKNGADFEQKILESKKDKFDFLQPNSPYRPYFDKMVQDLKEGKDASSEAPAIPKAILDIQKKRGAEVVKKKHVMALTQWGEDDEILPPAKSQFFVKHPYISPLDLDIVKTTALFVSRNGQAFLLGLSQREQSNPQFDFLKPTHSLFQYFTQMVEFYSKVIRPTNELIGSLKSLAYGHYQDSTPPKDTSVCIEKELYRKWNEENSGNKTLLSQNNMSRYLDLYLSADSTNLDELFTRPRRGPQDIMKESENMKGCSGPQAIIRERVHRRFKWESVQRKKRMDAEAKAQEEREANALIDWNDFQVVATVDFPPDCSTEPFVDLSVALPPMAPLTAPTGFMSDIAPRKILNVPHRVAEDVQEKPEPAPTPVVTHVAKSNDATTTAESTVNPISSTNITSTTSETIKIVKDYSRPVKRSFGDVMVGDKVMQRCPVTGQMVAASDMSEHIKILLLDPQWKKERDQLLRKAQAESAFAPTGDINQNLAGFVAGRPDLFGTIDDQVAITAGDESMGLGKDPKKARLWLQG